MATIIAIVGRPNVGKSTLFNRLSRSRDALVDDEPGITRDRLYALTRWRDSPLTLIDTGGFDDTDREPLGRQVKEQVKIAIEDAERIIFMVDGPQGVMPGDEEMADLLRRSEKRVFLAVNKIDGPEHDPLALDFYRLGLERVYPISAAHGYGLNAFMEEVIRELPKPDAERDDEGRIRVAVLGRPNVGKSSLINRILGFERLLVSERPGTTRDAVDILFRWQGREYLLIDTAGIRRRGRVKEKIEKFSIIKAIRGLERCHLAVILLDAAAGVAEQDARISGYALERGRGLIIGVNKWDLIEKDPEKKRHLDEALGRQLKFVSFAPRIYFSALTGEGVKKVFEKIDLLYGQFCKRLTTGTVNRVLEEMVRCNPPPRIGRGSLKFYYATQTGIKPPTFVVFTNRPDKVHFSYRRFMINQLRDQLDLAYTPVRLIFRKRGKGEKGFRK